MEQTTVRIDKSTVETAKQKKKQYGFHSLGELFDEAIREFRV